MDRCSRSNNVSSDVNVAINYCKHFCRKNIVYRILQRVQQFVPFDFFSTCKKGIHDCHLPTSPRSGPVLNFTIYVNWYAELMDYVPIFFSIFPLLLWFRQKNKFSFLFLWMKIIWNLKIKRPWVNIKKNDTICALYRFETILLLLSLKYGKMDIQNERNFQIQFHMSGTFILHNMILNNTIHIFNEDNISVMVRSKPFLVFFFLLFWHIKVIHCDIFSSHLGNIQYLKNCILCNVNFFLHLNVQHIPVQSTYTDIYIRNHHMDYSTVMLNVI